MCNEDNPCDLEQALVVHQCPSKYLAGKWWVKVKFTCSTKRVDEATVLCFNTKSEAERDMLGDIIYVEGDKQSMTKFSSEMLEILAEMDERDNEHYEEFDESSFSLSVESNWNEIGS